LPKLLIWLFAPFAVFVLWSFLEFSRPVPVYYDPGTWPSGQDFFGNLLAILWSPGRGLWLYMPFALLPVVGWLLPDVRKQPIWLMLWAWFVLHLVVVARSPMPWGGWCFGPRFFMEMVPGFALMLLLVSEYIEAFQAAMQKALVGALVAFLAFGIYVHTVQGVYEPATIGWNDNPNIDQRWAEERWDWRYPQFMANAYSNNRRIRELNTLLPVGQVSLRIPKGNAFIFGGPDLELRNMFAHWNRVDKLKGNRVYNTVHAIEQADEPAFYFTRDRLTEMKALKGWHIDSSMQRLKLGEFLEREEANIVLLGLQDEGSYQLSPESRKYMREHGSKIDSLKFRHSYAAIFEKGKVVWEDMGPKRIEYTWPGNPEVRIGSAGLEAGNWSRLMVGGQEYTGYRRGFNVLVISPTREIIWSTSFDTHKEDKEQLIFYRAVRGG
jgi:hypothetical protein